MSTAQALGCSAPTAFAAVQNVVDDCQVIAVVGLGALGLCAVAFAVARGLPVVGLDPSVGRRKLAEQFGAVGVFPNAATAVANGLVFGTVIDCSGAPDAEPFVLLEPDGLCLVVGGGERPNLSPQALIDGRLTVKGCLYYTPDDFDSMTRLIASTGLDLGPIVSRRFSSNEFRGALAYQQSGRGIKGVVVW
jgi:threonine dehydrogenase-like Zn-dependent dehydrogenase